MGFGSINPPGLFGFIATLASFGSRPEGGDFAIMESNNSQRKGAITMRKRFIVSCVLSILVTLLIAGTMAVYAKHAKQTKPASYDCTAIFCYSYQQWGSGTTMPMHGGDVFTYASNPNFTDSNASLERFDDIFNSSTNDNTTIAFGLVKTKGSPGGSWFCNGEPTWTYVFIWVADKNFNPVYTPCIALNVNDLHDEFALEGNAYFSNGGGWQFKIYDQTNGRSYCTYTTCYVSASSGAGLSQTVYFNRLEEAIHDHVTGKEVGAVSWYTMGFQCGGSWCGYNGTWHNWDRLPNTTHTGNPPQMYWVVDPGPSQPGQLVSCDYESGTLCT
jgi:hypothetical protein